ncbi:MAG: ATP-dependent DNA helicase RecG [Rhodocyclaceae bacterium]|nr:ATP-dependent DNA helicase RecG [Rhodocyclaceae bacterium]
MSKAATPKKAGNNTLAAKLARLGLGRDADLVVHLPLRYEDETHITMVRDAEPGTPAQFEVEVIDSEISFRPRRQLLVKTRDVSGFLLLRFLNFYPNQQKVLQPGARLRVFGEPRPSFGSLLASELIHPRFHVVSDDEPLPAGLTPIYPTTAGLAQTVLRRLVQRALGRVELSDTLPESVRSRLGLMPLIDAIRLLHSPPTGSAISELESREHPAWQRVQFDELLAQQLSLRRAYRARRERGAPVLAGTGTLTQALLARLPFALTRAQQRVANEIAIDLAQPYPMQRLLQGDVGAGKTVVAALAMLQAVESGYQAALMAPTEILAEQHYRKLAAWLEPLGHKVAWFAGSVKKREREAMSSQVGAGDTALAVGTHALIEDGVVFPRLGLAIVDEQHRFGVRQRLALKEKGQFAHQLTMSATPIPRTLAMSVYADMDVSIIDELPPGRTPIATRLISETRRHEVVARVHAACREGRQAYWVCPLIEESETLQLKTAEETYARLVEALPDLAVGLIHGRLKGEEKAAIMAAFARNEIQVLVATTVIEVGVDVPNASLMVIEHAERFGLAQLHQLRGRVGRGTAASSCILIYAQPLGQIARARLKIIYENTDGFEIARQDLQLRGPGEFVGARQSGLPLLRYASLDDTERVAQAQAVADELLQHYPEAAQAHLARWLGSREELLKA